MSVAQIIQPHITVHALSLRLTAPLPCNAYLQYSLSHSKNTQRTPEFSLNNALVIDIDDIKPVSFSLGNEGSINDQLVINLFLKNEGDPLKERGRDQLAGTISIRLLQIPQEDLPPIEYAFGMSSFDCFLTLSCKHTPNILNTSITPSMPFKYCQVTAEYEEQSPEKSHSPASRSDILFQELSKHSQQEEILVNRASFFSESSVVREELSSILQHRVRKIEQMDLTQLLAHNCRLERLLYLSRNERKMENERHDEDMKEMARDLSLREAEALRLREEVDSAQERAGQLLDECDDLLREKEELQQALQNQKLTTRKLQLSYDALAANVSQICEETLKIQTLRDELAAQSKQKTQLEEQIRTLRKKEEEWVRQEFEWLKREKRLQGEISQLEKRLCDAQQSCRMAEGNIQQMKEEDLSRGEMAELCKQYQRKLAQLQDKIDSIQSASLHEQNQDDEGQQAEFVHHGSYSSYSGNPIRIEEEECQLRRIVEEQLEESLPLLEDNVRRSLDDPKYPQIVTATTLSDPSHRNQLELLQMLTINLQRQHRQLKQLYRQQEEQLIDKHYELQHMEKSLSQMRFQFMIELSRVTALMNQQILQNQSLREINQNLLSTIQHQNEQQSVVSHNKIVYHEANKLSGVMSSCIEKHADIKGEKQYCERCKQLLADNQMLLPYNLQRQKPYEMIMSKVEPTLNQQRIEESLNYVFNHRQQHASLNKYNHSQIQPTSQFLSKLSHLGDNRNDSINDPPPNKIEAQSQIRKLEALRSHNQLLIQSTARDCFRYQQIPSLSLHSLQTTISELSALYREREKISMTAFRKEKCSQEGQDGTNEDDDNKMRQLQQMRKKLQKLKVLVMRDGKDCRSQALTLMVELQKKIQNYCITTS